MKSVSLLCCLYVILQRVHLSTGFFGGSIPGIPNVNGRGQLGNCYLFSRVCNANAIRITDVPPYNQPVVRVL